MAKREPVVKHGVNKGRRVYWVEFPCCSQPPSKEHVSKAGANVVKRNHTCDG